MLSNFYLTSKKKISWLWAFQNEHQTTETYKEYIFCDTIYIIFSQRLLHKNLKQKQGI